MTDRNMPHSTQQWFPVASGPTVSMGTCPVHHLGSQSHHIGNRVIPAVFVPQGFQVVLMLKTTDYDVNNQNKQQQHAMSPVGCSLHWQL